MKSLKYFVIVILLTFSQFLYAEDKLSSDKAGVMKKSERSNHDFDEPHWPFMNIRREIDRIFDTPFGVGFIASSWNKGIHVDIIDNGKEILVKADVPGLSEEDLSIKFSNNNLIIQKNRKQHKKEEKENYYIQERNYESFMRSIPLPFKAEADKIEAELDKGVLTISIPKSAESLQHSTKIKIKRK